tara:strand:- start:313 stop:696 length:384 start_codon:yes stop_codon:yes gene_type:complete
MDRKLNQFHTNKLLGQLMIDQKTRFRTGHGEQFIIKRNLISVKNVVSKKDGYLMAINLIPLKATVFFEPDEYVQYCEDNCLQPSLDGFEEYVINEMKYKGSKKPLIERDWSNYRGSYLVKDEDETLS